MTESVSPVFFSVGSFYFASIEKKAIKQVFLLDFEESERRA